MSFYSAIRVLCGVALLAGCAETKVGAIQFDGNLPAGLEASHLCKLGARLERPGDWCATAVDARDPWNVLPLAVQAGEMYQLTVPAGQFWWDTSRRIDPRVGDDGNWLMRFAAKGTTYPIRVPLARAKFFELIAGPVQCWSVGPKPQSNDSLQVKDCNELAPLRPVGTGIAVTIPDDAVLAAFANDITSYYGNNGGRVYLIVRRCPEPAMGDCANSELPGR